MATFVATNFPQQIIFNTASFELFIGGQGHLEILKTGSILLIYNLSKGDIRFSLYYNVGCFVEQLFILL